MSSFENHKKLHKLIKRDVKSINRNTIFFVIKNVHFFLWSKRRNPKLFRLNLGKKNTAFSFFTQSIQMNFILLHHSISKPLKYFRYIFLNVQV